MEWVNVILNGCIVVALAFVIRSDLKWRIIQSTCIALLAGLGIFKVLLRFGALALLMRMVSLLAVFLICVLIGYFYKIKKDVDLAGGGDYKLISVYALLFGLQGLFLCFVLELVYEIIYRYILFPERKKMAIPLGASFGLLGIILTIWEGFS